MRLDPARAWPRAGYFVSIACLVIAAIALSHHRLLTGSVDLAHHLQMTDAVLRHGFFSTEYLPYLEDLNAYPKLSHAFAAGLMALGMGGIDALTLLAVLSAAACWFCMIVLTLRMSLATLAAALVLLAGLIVWPGVVTGYEIVDNFFYSQLMAQAVCAIGVLIGADLAWRAKKTFAVFAPALTYFCGWLHVVGAMDLALALSALAALRFVRTLAKERQIDLWALATIVATAAGLLLGPSFMVMSGWVNAAGGVNFFHKVSALQLGLTGAVLLAAAGAGFVKLAFGREALDGDAARGERAAAAILGLGAAIGFVVFAQWMMLAVFHTGADYAVFKHAFGLFTLAAFALPALVWLYWRPAFLRVQTPAPVRFAAIVLAPLAIVVALLHGPSRIDVAAAQETITEVAKLRPAGEENGQAYMFVDTRAPSLVSYMASIVGLRAERDLNFYALLHTRHPMALGSVAHVITRDGDPYYDVPGCEQQRVKDLVVEAGACAAPQRVLFSPGSIAVTYLKRGWSTPEATGVWSDGPVAELVVTLPNDLPKDVQPILQLGTVGFVPPPDPVRSVRVQVEDGPVQEPPVEFSAAFAMSHTYALPIPPESVAAGKMRVRFHIERPVTPQSLGLGTDVRALGVGLTWMAILPDERMRRR